VIIACPSCGARFNLDPAKLLPAGRNVRCAKCEHRWRQMPEGTEEPAEFATPEPLPPEPPDEPAPQAAESAPPPPEEAETHPPSPPETAAEMAQSLAAIAEQVTGVRGEGHAISEAAAKANPIARLARKTSPGPITVPPRMRPMRPAKRSSNLGLFLIAGLVIGLLIAGYVFRGVISRTVPGADAVYALLHLSTDNPAADLEISDFHIDAHQDKQTGKQVLQVQATIFNLSQYPLNVPPLVLSAVDAAGGDLEPVKFRLNEQMIEPGQNVKFQITVRDWPPNTAASYGLDWDSQ
jgi:predicted Zn finger-like uncharacterized protein